MPNTIKFRNEELHLQFGRYKDTNMVALQLYDSNGFPYMTASFNPVEVPDTDTTRLIAIKNWSENEGIEKALLDNNVFEKFVKSIPTGYVNGSVYIVNKEFLGDK
tara:strand:- start:700 stop:1014 length:315 start_codon:yes stop_codon:yes gene_type:complete